MDSSVVKEAIPKTFGFEAATLSGRLGNITLNNVDKKVVDFTGLWRLFGVK